MIVFDELRDDFLCIRVDSLDKWRVEGIPARLYNRAEKMWEIPIRPNVHFLRENFKRENFTDAAIAAIKRSLEEDEAHPYGGRFPGQPMAHQRKALDLAHNKKNFFFAHATGAGKTYTVLTLAADLYIRGEIDSLLVVCPTSIMDDVWVEQAKMWLPDLVKYEIQVISPSRYKNVEQFLTKEPEGLQILVVGVQGLSNDKHAPYNYALKFLKGRRAAMMVDESSRIKNPQANRTENVIYLGSFACYRWCGTGTKITQGLHDLYAQFRFLDWAILGHRSYYTFKNRYVIMGGFEGKQIIGFTQTNELFTLIRPYIHEVRKEDANELPPKVYQRRHIEPSAEQAKLYKQLKTSFEMEYKGQTISVDTFLEQYTRLQQLCGGNFPIKTADGSWTTTPITPNPKLTELLDILDEIDGKVIIWARFVAEVEQIIEALKKKYGTESTVGYYGKIDPEERSFAIRRLRHDWVCRFFVATQAAAGIGLTLIEATTAIYYSNSFSYEDRYQSEDRNHRTGQKSSVTYIDLVLNTEVEANIAEAIERKQSIAAYVSAELILDASAAA